jgi:hypothetical protein
MGIDDAAAPSRKDVLDEAVLQKLALPASGQSNNVGVKSATLRRDPELREECILASSSENKFVRTMSQDCLQR